MPTPAQQFDTTKFIQPAQVGGIQSYEIADGAGRGVRALWVNTGGGLRYRVLVDRGLDIDQGFHNQHSLAFLTHGGVTRPSRAYDAGIAWLASFPGGLLTSCGPFNIGPPGEDEGELLGLHGHHSNTPASIESIVQPDPHGGQDQMSITGVIRYGRFFARNLQLRRTIRSRLGDNRIEITDEFTNAGNQPVPHAWLLHVNLGYPLVDEGAEFCYDAERVEPVPTDESRERFKPGATYKTVPPPLESHRGANEAVAYLFPRAAGDGTATVGIVNGRLGLGVAIRYSTREFGRCLNWQHWGPGEYVTALEPVNGTVRGRAADRADGTLDHIQPGARKAYTYRIEVVTDQPGLDALRKLNR
ncbi:MAG TPA: DUF4432 family protein [Tepidisphaeraceae bacterium]|nr:DUF4432 family protein [Tepidisphaeraceae bacterium]